MSRGVYRGIHSSLLDDPDYQKLSARARHVLVTVRLCRDAGPAVIFRYYPAVIAAQTGLTPRQVEGALVELEGTRWIIRDAAVLWVRNGLRHDPNVRLADKKHMFAVVRQLEALPSSSASIAARFCEYYKISRAIQGPSRENHAAPPNTESEVLPDTEVLPESEDDCAAQSLAATNGHSPAADDWGTPEQLVSLYNQLAPPNHPHVTRLTPARRKKAIAYLRDFPERTFWVRAFSEIQFSRLLTRGSPERPSFRGDLDWLLTVGKNGAENCVKTAEGKFRDKEHAS